MKPMRKFMRRSLALLLSLVLVLPASALAADDEDDEGITGEPVSIEADEGTPKTLRDDSSITTVNYSVTYGQTNARSILGMVNEFRQSSDAWYWNEDNETKTELEGKLSNYTYDYDLEKVAMQRAAEIAIYYSHTRPNGGTCWTAYSDFNYDCSARAENIAVNYSTAENVFVGWREDNDNYDGQGHRRNMLSSTYTAIGIAGVEYDGTYYWVQEFSNKVNDESLTTANDSETGVSAEVADDEVTSASLNAYPSSYALPANGTDSLPVISGTIKLTETWPSSKTCSLTSVDATWSSADSSVASVSDTTVTGLKSGETTLTAEALGESFSVPVSVASLSSATVTLSEDSYTYDGSAKTPDVTVQFGSSTLIQGTDYTVSYSNNTNAGTATVTVTGAGDYEGSQEVTFTINKASQNLTASLADSSIVVGDTTSITASGEGTISYESSDNSVATVDSNGVVTGIGVGEATITVTASGNDNYESASEQLSIKVTKKGQTVTASIEDPSIAVDETTTIIANGEGEISYESDNTKVATVDESGVVTGVGAGEATITITAAGNDEYDSASTTLSVEVTKGSQELTASIKSSSIKVDETTTITASGKGEISYESSDTSVATVNSSGVVTGVGVGTATITVTADGGNKYESASTTFDIEVTKGSQTLTASLASSSIVIGKTTTITASGKGEISYESSDTSVATVDEDGVVTGVNAGTATITVTASGDENYEPASKELSIKVTKESQTLTVSIASSSILVGKTTTITASGEGEISYESSDTSVATVSSSGVVTGVAAGSATITVTAAGDDYYEAASKTLSIKVTKQDQSLTAKAKSSTIVVGKTTTISASGKGTITYTSSDKKIATVSSSGKVTAKAPGKVTITVKAAGNSNYNSASKKVTIKVNPKAPSIKSAKNSKSKKATVKWKKVSGVTGYQIQYSTSKSFSSKKSTTVKGASKVSKTLSKLKKGKTYYIRIRAYKTVSGTKYYSSWSGKKSVKIKK